MKATREKTENHQAYLTIEVEPAEMENSMEVAYNHLNQKTRIPGFRKGKTPRAIFERYVGKESLIEEALNHVVPEVYEQALKEQSIEAIAQPEIEVTQTEPVIFKAVVPLKPTVTLGDYHSIKVEQKPVEVTEDNVNAVIEQLRHQHATWEPVERGVKFDDLVAMDVEGNVEGQSFLTQKDAQYQVRKDQSYPLPGFSEQLIGLNNNEEKEFKLKMPEDYQNKELIGKEAKIKVQITGIKQEKLPEINDNLAKTVNPDLLTVDAMREQASKELRTRAEERNRLDFEQQVIDAVVERSEIAFPPVVVESEISRIISQRFQNSRQVLDNYIRMTGKTETELRDELKPEAIKSVSRSLALSQVAEDGKIEVSEADIDAEIDKMTSESTTARKEELVKYLNNPDIRHSIMHTLQSRKTFQLLTDIAKVPVDTGTNDKEKTKETEATKEKKTRKKKEDK